MVQLFKISFIAVLVPGLFVSIQRCFNLFLSGQTINGCNQLIDPCLFSLCKCICFRRRNRLEAVRSVSLC